MAVDKLTSIKIRQDNGTYSNQIPVSVLAEHVEWDNDNNLVDVLGSVDIQEKGNIQYQLNQLFNTKISVSELNNYVYNNLEQTITGWLDSNIEPGNESIIIDKSLSIEGAAADAKATTDTFYTKTEMNQIIATTTGDIRWQIPQGTHGTYPVTIQGNRIIINGTMNATLARTVIYGPILRVKTAAPTYLAYPEIYFDPITSFIPGHKIKAKITLINGEYEFTGRYNKFYMDLRNIENGNTSTNPWQFNDEDEKIIDFQPQTIVFGIPQGEYNNVILEFSMIDMDATDKTLSIENKPADARATGKKINDLINKLQNHMVPITGTFIQGYYPLATNEIGVSSSAKMMIYPVQEDKIYLITWNSTANKYRTAFGNTDPTDITTGTIIYDYEDNIQTSHINYPRKNVNGYKYLYVYIGNQDITTEESIEVSINIFNNIESCFGFENEIW